MFSQSTRTFLHSLSTLLHIVRALGRHWPKKAACNVSGPWSTLAPNTFGCSTMRLTVEHNGLEMMLRKYLNYSLQGNSLMGSTGKREELSKDGEFAPVSFDIDYLPTANCIYKNLTISLFIKMWSIDFKRVHIFYKCALSQVDGNPVKKWVLMSKHTSTEQYSISRSVQCTRSGNASFSGTQQNKGVPCIVSCTAFFIIWEKKEWSLFEGGLSKNYILRYSVKSWNKCALLLRSEATYAFPCTFPLQRSWTLNSSNKNSILRTWFTS